MGIIGIFIIWVICYIFYKIYINNPRMKGYFSEMLVRFELSRLSDEYIIINNLLMGGNGRHVQIDHIIVSPYGVFVIETKGYKGLITGGETSEYWTQNFYRNRYRFYNPIKQNDGHVKYLRFLLQSSSGIPLIPIVCFPNYTALQVYVENHIVVNRRLLTLTIEQYQRRILSEEQIQQIVTKIQNNCKVHNKFNVEVQKGYAKRMKLQALLDLNNGTCPKCGSELVLKRGKYGSFVGCSNYPFCSFTTKY